MEPLRPHLVLGAAAVPLQPALGGTILLVEDNPDDVSWVRFAFAGSRILNPLQVAQDGQEAISYFLGDGKYSNREDFPVPILVLLDLMMPRKSGFEVLEWLKAQPRFKALPVIVLSGMTDLALLSKAYQMGALTFMLKPLRPEELTVRFPRLRGCKLVSTEHGAHYIEVN